MTQRHEVAITEGKYREANIAKGKYHEANIAEGKYRRRQNIAKLISPKANITK
jgi:hypothetical protein